MISEEKPVRVAINGAAGRMGRRLMALAVADEGLALVGALEYAAHPALGKDIAQIEPEAKARAVLAATLDTDADVLVDFSAPESTVQRAREMAQMGVALVVGTTGLNPEQEAAVREAATAVPVLHASNYSLGINLLLRVAAEVAAALGEDFDIEIAESHHNRKADAPSGTAMSLARSVCEATGRTAATDLVYGRQGRPGPRSRREIGVHALRLGSVTGEHTVHFGSLFERIELTHRAETRDVFAAGALRAAKWLAGREPGMYSMNHVLFGG